LLFIAYLNRDEPGDVTHIWMRALGWWRRSRPSPSPNDFELY
jgi:hypothetical protein